MGTRRTLRAAFCVAVVTAGLVGINTLPSGAAVASQLTRYPYLTDAVGTQVKVSWATDRSSTTGSLKWGAVSGTTCTATNTVSATRYPITVNGVSQYQWIAQLSLPAAGSYCYRPFLSSTDLLGTDASPRFKTQVPKGSAESYSFVVFGDWGQVDASGNNTNLANLMSRINTSGARFAVSVGDNAYPSGSQTNYGDLKQKGANLSAVFGPSFWTVPGRSIPMFAASGNHGFSNSTGTRSTEQFIWPSDTAAATSGGRYVKDTYCCVNGTASASYPSSWYAFDAGGTRYYVLMADWADSNLGTGTAYSNDYAAHWAQSTAQYQWLKNDLATHPGGLKFAFFHYPMYSDQKSETSDTFLRGANSLEGLLAANGVSLGFSGHAHLYQRNVPGTPGTFPNYITGGGGADLQSIGEVGCSAFDKYGIGWSGSKNQGNKCGAAPVPDSPTRVYHFLKVTVNGTSVTVTPTDSLGRTFDVQTYNFAGTVAPDTIIDSAPPSPTSSTSGSVAFHSSLPGSTFTCKVDTAAATACTSPLSLSNLAQGSHTVTVTATANGKSDPTPATATWVVDTTGPAAPGGLSATSTSSSVTLSWSAASDPSGIAGYDVVRDGTQIGSVPGNTTSFFDGGVAPNTTYQYQVRARDGAGNPSPLSTALPVTTPAGGGTPPIFSDGFESGNLSAWSTSGGLTVQSATVHSGGFAAEGNTTAGATYAKEVLPATYTDGYSRVWFNVKSSASQVNLLRHRTAADGSLAYVFVTASGALGVRNDVGATTVTSALVVPPGSGWHELELHTVINGTASTIEVWLDGARVDALSTTAANLGTTPIGKVQIGEVQNGRTYDVVLDDAAFGTTRVGP
jgi:hypothetical protein